MTRVHELEIQSEIADAIMSGDLTFDIRYNDVGYQKGDLVKYIPKKNHYIDSLHPIANKTFEISYVYASSTKLQPDCVVFGIKTQGTSGFNELIKNLRVKEGDPV